MIEGEVANRGNVRAERRVRRVGANVREGPVLRRVMFVRSGSCKGRMEEQQTPVAPVEPDRWVMLTVLETMRVSRSQKV